MDIYLIVLVIVLLIVVGLGFKQYRTLKEQLETYETRFAEVIDVDKEVALVTADKEGIENSLDELRKTYAEKRKIFDELVKESAIYDETIQLAELGFYKPHFEFDASQSFKDEITKVRGLQKGMATDKTAITSRIEFEIDGNKTKGRAMTNKSIRLAARAFNNECDAVISNVSWNNVKRMEQRIHKAFDAINKLNESLTISISPKYRDLKVDELRLTHEYRNKRQEEKEEQAEIKRRMREEAKLLQEADQAVSEEQKYERLLEKARKDAAGANAEKLKALQAKIEDLDRDLKEAHEKSERAKSMAEQTKSGHIYIISNVGSFGEDVYKIGMTRRLDPLDRVRELGDASVPFIFDIHAMVYAKDAPAVEKALHKSFEAKRVNLVNTRKEFFQTTLEEVRNEVVKSFPDAEFIETGEAREYRETLALREELSKASAVVANKYPDAI